MSRERPDARIPVVPKQDPQKLVLRGRPRAVIRFRRAVIIGLAAALAVSLAGLAWLALEPSSFRLAGAEDQPQSAVNAAPEAIAAAPATYADVPQLGPPLPGDLGRAIVEQEHKGRAEGIDAGRESEERSAVEGGRQRLAEEQQSARSSPVLVRLERGDREGETSSPPAVLPPPPDDPAAGGRARPQERPSDAVAPPSTLSAGTVISASLLTGLNSDLPGVVLAQVTEPVRDSATGRTVIIPQGARLVGSYDSKVAAGQKRALIVWRRIVFPDGSSVELDGVPATDSAGYSGVRDRVDSHGSQLIRNVVLSSLLGIGSELSLGHEDSDLVRAVRESTERSGESAGDRMVSKGLDVPPTLTVRPGWPVRAVLQKNLNLQPWRG